jgi:hypothetical protein
MILSYRDKLQLQSVRILQPADLTSKRHSEVRLEKTQGDIVRLSSGHVERLRLLSPNFALSICHAPYLTPASAPWCRAAAHPSCGFRRTGANFFQDDAALRHYLHAPSLSLLPLPPAPPLYWSSLVSLLIKSREAGL